jgi:hypothetical protein
MRPLKNGATWLVWYGRARLLRVDIEKPVIEAEKSAIELADNEGYQALAAEVKTLRADVDDPALDGHRN